MNAKGLIRIDTTFINFTVLGMTLNDEDRHEIILFLIIQLPNRILKKCTFDMAYGFEVLTTKIH